MEKKGQEINVPDRLYEEKYLRALFRWLFDTDGGIYAHPNSGIIMNTTAKNTSLLDFLDDSAIQLDLALIKRETGLGLWREKDG